ncbi:MAG TPA: hypothetical protein VNW71_05810, partial [Thermoanaerobaculia bacterium]|nr:hypothetical protein [Thermoanaerobaculia bacterium]
MSGATQYRVFLSTSSSTLSALSSTTTTCSGCLVNTTTTSDSYTVPSGTLANSTTYYWMVRAGGPSGGSLNSAIRSFTTVAGSLATPNLVSPANGATGISITPLLDWSAVSGATQYRVFLSTSSSTLSALSSTTTTCSGCLINTTTTADSYTVPSGILANNTIYYWMVRAGGPSGGSPNSAIRSFTTVAGSLATPSLLSPANGATGISITPLLDWSAVSGATQYRVFLSTSSSTLSALSSTTTNCSGCLINTTTTADSYTVPSGILANNTIYYWMVRAGGPSGGSPNSAIRSFTTVAGPLATPSLLSPANGATGISITPLL